MSRLLLLLMVKSQPFGLQSPEFAEFKVMVKPHEFKL
jgi:hypothetical protein